MEAHVCAVLELEVVMSVRRNKNVMPLFGII
jgi:hypothetical protein